MLYADVDWEGGQLVQGPLSAKNGAALQVLDLGGASRCTAAAVVVAQVAAHCPDLRELVLYGDQLSESALSREQTLLQDEHLVLLSQSCRQIAHLELFHSTEQRRRNVAAPGDALERAAASSPPHQTGHRMPALCSSARRAQLGSPKSHEAAAVCKSPSCNIGPDSTRDAERCPPLSTSVTLKLSLTPSCPVGTVSSSSHFPLVPHPSSV